MVFFLFFNQATKEIIALDVVMSFVFNFELNKIVANKGYLSPRKRAISNHNSVKTRQRLGGYLAVWHVITLEATLPCDFVALQFLHTLKYPLDLSKFSDSLSPVQCLKISNPATPR